MSLILLGLAVMCCRVRQAAGEQRESAFAQAAQTALEGVAGASADIELPPVCGLLDGDVDADARAVIAGVSEGGQPGGGGPVQRGQGVAAGGCDVMHRARLGDRYPQREPVRGDDRLDVAAMGMGFAGIPHVDELALDADSLLPAPVRRDDRAVQDHMRKALVTGPLQRLAQIRSLVREYRDHFLHIAVGGSPRDAVIAGQGIRGYAVAEPPQPQHRLPETGQCPAAPRGAATPPLSHQQPRGELRQFPGDVKRGTTGDHVEPSGGSRSCGETSSTGLHAHFRAARLVRVSALMSYLGG